MTDNEAAIAAMEAEAIPFLGVDDLEFDGAPLNTSASRFDFVTRWAMDDLMAINQSAASIYPIAKKTVFACSLSKEEFRRVRRNPGEIEDGFDEWNDAKHLVPSNKERMDQLVELSTMIWDGWNGSASEPDEEAARPKEDDSGKERRPA